MSIPLALGIGAGVGLVGTWVDPAFIWAAFAGFLGWSVLRRRRMFALLRENDDGVALIAANEYERAAALYERLCHDARRTPALHSLFLFNRCVVDLETGHLDVAVAGLRAVVEAGWIREKGSLAVYYAGVLGTLALGEALLGQLAAAEAWQKRAHSACSPAKVGTLLLVDVVIAARRGQFEVVLERIADDWRRAENLLSSKHLRRIRLFEAFALAQSRGCEYRQPSREDELRRALGRVREVPPGSYDHLAPHWPELREFLELHDLGGVQPS